MPQATSTDAFAYERLEDVGESDASLCPFHEDEPIVRYDAAVDRDSLLLAPSFELPRIKRAIGIGPMRHAFVLKQVLRCLRRAVLVEVARCSHNDEAKRLGEPHADHVALQIFAHPNPGVEAGHHDVDSPIIEDAFHVDPRVPLPEFRQRRAHHERERRPRRGQSHAPDHLAGL